MIRELVLLTPDEGAFAPNVDFSFIVSGSERTFTCCVSYKNHTDFAVPHNSKDDILVLIIFLIVNVNINITSTCHIMINFFTYIRKTFSHALESLIWD